MTVSSFFSLVVTVERMTELILMDILSEVQYKTIFPPQLKQAPRWQPPRRNTAADADGKYTLTNVTQIPSSVQRTLGISPVHLHGSATPTAPLRLHHGPRLACGSPRPALLPRYRLYFLRSSSYLSSCATNASLGQVASHCSFISAAAWS